MNEKLGTWRDFYLTDTDKILLLVVFFCFVFYVSLYVILVFF